MAKKVTSKDHFTSMLVSYPQFPGCLFLKPRKRGSRVTTLEFEGKTYTPQRLAWTLAYGEPAPATRVVAHCKHLHPNSICCNPEHLNVVALHYDHFTTPGKAGRPAGSKTSYKEEAKKFDEVLKTLPIKRGTPYY